VSAPIDARIAIYQEAAEIYGHQKDMADCMIIHCVKIIEYLLAKKAGDRARAAAILQDLSENYDDFLTHTSEHTGTIAEVCDRAGFSRSYVRFSMARSCTPRSQALDARRKS